MNEVKVVWEGDWWSKFIHLKQKKENRLRIWKRAQFDVYLFDSLGGVESVYYKFQFYWLKRIKVLKFIKDSDNFLAHRLI